MQSNEAAQGVEAAQGECDDLKPHDVARLVKEQTFSLWVPFADFAVQLRVYEVVVIQNEERRRGQKEQNVESVIDRRSMLDLWDFRSRQQFL